MSSGMLNSTDSPSCPPVDPDNQAEQVLKTLAYAIVISLSLVGNTIVIFTVCRNRHLKSVTNFFIANLAASDLLITFLAMPNMITEMYVDKWIFGPVICKLVVYFQSVSVGGSVLTLLAITKDRFVAIVFPFHPRLGFGTAKIIIVVIWALALGIMAPLIYAMRVINENCREEWSPAFDSMAAPRDYTIVLFIMLYAVPLLTMAILYAIIAKKLWRRRVGEIVNSSDVTIQAARKKVIKMLMTVIILFALSWLPLHVYTFIWFGPPLVCFDSRRIFYFVGLFLGHANSAINPFLYALFNKNYREGFKAACGCIFRKRTRRLVQTQSTYLPRRKKNREHSGGVQKQNAGKGKLNGEINGNYRPRVLSFNNVGTYEPNVSDVNRRKRKSEQDCGITGISYSETLKEIDPDSGSVTMQFQNVSYQRDSFISYV